MNWAAVLGGYLQSRSRSPAAEKLKTKNFKKMMNVKPQNPKREVFFRERKMDTDVLGEGERGRGERRAFPLGEAR